MGQAQSGQSGKDGSSGDEPCRCHYDVLGIDIEASDDEIKKAYRRKALELHPDRNYGNVENVTSLFAEVQSAYEVLSDPQERAWYDSHRNEILHNVVDDQVHYERNIRVTTADDITRMYMNFGGQFGFSDEPTGFFNIFRELFTRLADEESVASGWEGLEPLEYPEFGESKDDYETIKKFYPVWSNFSTRKPFSWKDLYRQSDAPDRRTRRAMDKENKRLRDEGIREFNNTVRALVAFVRKRDPRYQPNTQTQEERQKVLREMASAQAARSRAANLAKVANQSIPEWSQSREDEENEDVGEFEASERDDVEHFECVVCQKTFKSENQYQAHEKSKKHVKATQQLLRRLRKENAELGLSENDHARHGLERGDGAGSGGSERNSIDGSKMKDEPTSGSSQEQEHEQEILSSPERNEHESREDGPLLEDRSSGKSRQSREDSSSNDSGESDQDYAPREKVQQRMLPTDTEHDQGIATMGSLADNLPETKSSAQPEVRLGKAKAKRAKKAAKQSNPDPDTSAQCGVCQQRFESKNKLFEHIELEGHAALKNLGSGSGKHNSKKNRR